MDVSWDDHHPLHSRRSEGTLGWDLLAPLGIARRVAETPFRLQARATPIGMLVEEVTAPL
jgi:hypothetical protein